jgi:hypothetical protein
MRQEDRGTSADPRDTRIVCDWGASLSLEELFQPGRLGACPAERPWIADRDPNRCDAGLRLLTRSATNTYFPQVAGVISLPQTVDELARRIEDFWSVLEGCTSAGDVGMARRFNPALKASLEDIPTRASSRGSNRFPPVALKPRLPQIPRLRSLSCSPAANP